MDVSLTNRAVLTGEVLEIPVPYNLKAEAAVLGSLLLDRDAIVVIEPFLLAGDFYRETHGWIYQAVLDLYRRREPPDLVTLSSELGRHRVGKTLETLLDAVGGLAYLSALMHGVPTAVHIEYYAHLVERAAMLRRLITVGGQIAGLGYEEGLELPIVFDKAESLLLGVTQRLKRGAPVRTLQRALDSYMADLAARLDGAVPSPGWTTGLPRLDNLIGGLRPGKFVVVIGESGGGKSTFGLGLTLAAMQAGARVGFYSLEMTEADLAKNVLAHDALVDSAYLRAGTVSDAEFLRLQQAYEWRKDQGEVPLVTGGGFTYRDIAAQARAWQVKGGLDVLAVDYLGLVRLAGRAGERTNEVDDLVNSLAMLGKELNIPVVTFSQISNQGHTADPEEWLHYTRGGGAIRHAADVIIAVAPQGDRPADGTQDWPIQLIVSKHRDGPTGTVPAYWYLAYSKMTETRIESDV